MSPCLRGYLLYSHGVLCPPFRRLTMLILDNYFIQVRTEHILCSGTPLGWEEAAVRMLYGALFYRGQELGETHDNKLISKLISENNAIKNAIKKTQRWEFPESPVGRTLCFHC